jgi:uncharacterized protein
VTPWGVLGGGLLAAAGLRLLTAWQEQRLLYRRSGTFRAQPEDAGLTAEEVNFCAEDGAALHGWWFAHPEAKGVLLVCHGNAGNISDRLWIPRDLADVELDVFLFDYRGYGKSGGLPHEKGTGRDVRAAYEVCCQRWEVRTGTRPKVVLYGRSLGGAVALQAAETCPVQALILESTFTSVLEMGERFHPLLLPRLFCMNRYRSDERIRKTEVPVLVAHSPDDEVIPYDMGQRLYALAPNPRGFVTLSGLHDEAGWQTSPEYARAVRRLIREVTG